MALPNNNFVSYEEFLNIQNKYEGKVEYNSGEIIYRSPT